MPFRITAHLTALTMLCAMPAIAHAADIERPLPPPPSPMTRAYLAPFSGEQRMGWLGECRQSLTRGDHPDMGAIDQSCQAWLHYYESGGAPDPTYGYAVPMQVSGGVDCLPCPPARPIRHYRPRKIVHDKRIKL
jgi:hypothetical protein